MGWLFLVVVDAHSRWIEVIPVPSTSAEVTIGNLQTLFPTHGIPEQIISDNGSGLTIEEFQKFTSVNGIQHLSSNGLNRSSSNERKKVDGLIHHPKTEGSERLLVWGRDAWRSWQQLRGTNGLAAARQGPSSGNTLLGSVDPSPCLGHHTHKRKQTFATWRMVATLN